MKKLCLSLVALFLIQIVTANGQEVLRAGAAKGNITPELGAVPAGEFDPIPSAHIHDDLWVRCMALDDGQTSIAFVVCDLIGVGAGLTQAACELIEQETRMPARHVMISGTHTHSAPRASYERYNENKKLVLTPYQQFVLQRIVDTVRCALNNLEPAQVGWAIAEAPEHVFNRRWFVQQEGIPMDPFGSFEDKIRWNPPVKSPYLIKPAGPVDPQLFVVGVRRPNGSPIAMLSNYSLHYVGRKPADHISADYYGMFNERVPHLLQAGQSDPPFVSLMSNGTSGDINNIDRLNHRPKQAPYEQMRLVAYDLAQKAVMAYKTIQWQDSVKLGALKEEIVLDYRRFTDEQIEFAKAAMKNRKKGQKPRNAPERFAPGILSKHKNLVGSAQAPLQAFRIGDLGIAAFPGEVFCETGLDMKQRTPFKAGFSISLANASLGYFPTPEQIKLGGYEAWVRRFESDAAPKMLEHLLQMLRRLQAQ